MAKTTAPKKEKIKLQDFFELGNKEPLGRDFQRQLKRISTKPMPQETINLTKPTTQGTIKHNKATRWDIGKNNKKTTLQNLKKTEKLLALNLQLSEAFKELIVPLINHSEKHDIRFPQTAYYLIPESYRLYRNMVNSDRQDIEQLIKSNLQYLEAIKELLNVLIAYSEKNGISLPLNLYHLVFEANKLHQSLISDEILQGHRTDEDLTVPANNNSYI